MELYLDSTIFIDCYLEGLTDEYVFSQNKMTCTFPKVDINKIEKFNFKKAKEQGYRIFISNLTILETFNVLRLSSKFYSDSSIPLAFRSADIVLKGFPEGYFYIIRDEINWSELLNFCSKIPALSLEGASDYMNTQDYVHLFNCHNREIKDGGELYFVTENGNLLKSKNKLKKCDLNLKCVVSLEEIQKTWFG